MGRDRAGKVRLLVMTRPSGNQRKEFSSGAGPSSGLVRALTYDPSIELPDCGLHANWGFFFFFTGESRAEVVQGNCRLSCSQLVEGREGRQEVPAFWTFHGGTLHRLIHSSYNIYWVLTVIQSFGNGSLIPKLC